MPAAQRTFGALWSLTLLWIAYLAWSFWVAEASPLEGIYFEIRDRLEPAGYAIGKLHRAPTWAIFHLVLAAAPAWLLLSIRRILARR